MSRWTSIPGCTGVMAVLAEIIVNITEESRYKVRLDALCKESIEYMLHLMFVCVCAATDIMDQRCWQELKTVAEDKGLEALSEHTESLVMDTHAAATVRAYEGAYGR